MRSVVTGRQGAVFGGMALIGAILVLATSTMHARQSHPLEDWLYAHPEVADAIVWEFPPPGGVPYKGKANGPGVWNRFTVVPYPSTYPSLDFSVFPSRLLDEYIDDRDFSPSMFDEGHDPGRIESTLPKFTKPEPRNPGVTLPGFKLDFLPSGMQISDKGAEIRAWTTWSEPARQQLRDRFDAYMLWTDTACPLYAEYAASNFTQKPAGFDAAFSSVVDLDPNGVFDPPMNLQPDDINVPGSPWTMLSSNAAFALYVRLVAAQLAMELSGCLPWSLTEYSGDDLARLFDGRSNFRWAVAGPSQWGTLTATGHVAVGHLLPAPPLIVFGFLGQQKLIGEDRLDTVLRVFNWEREHFWHSMGGTTNPPLPAGVLYMGYNGKAPVSRMINGTVMAAPLLFSNGGSFYEPAPQHWVGGCGGASGFNAEVLRVLNIPVEKTFYGHQQNRFTVGPGERVSTAHADDSYGSIRNAPEIPMSAILLDDATFQEWFIDESDPATLDRNSARRSADIQLQYLPVYTLKLHCSDVAAGRSHADSLVYGSAFKTAYTVAELEAKGLWTGIEAKLPTVGGCVALGYPNLPI